MSEPVDRKPEAGLWPLPYLIELDRQKISTALSRLPFDKSMQSFDLQQSLSDVVRSRIMVCSQAQSKDELADFLGTESFYLCSGALKSLLLPFVRKTEFFEAEVELTAPTDDDCKWGGGPVIGDYWIMNCWNRLDLVDWDASDYMPVDPNNYPIPTRPGAFPKSLTWKKLVVRNPPADEHLFGIEGFGGRGQGSRYLSPRLALTIIQSGLKVEFRQESIDPAYQWKWDISKDIEAVVGASNNG